MKKRTREGIAGISFVLPAFILLFTFIIVPIIQAVYFSFTEHDGFHEPVWIGLKNFIEMTKDKGVTEGLKNTIKYVIITAPITIFLSLVLAALVAHNFQSRFGNFVRSTLFVPVVCSGTIIASVWSVMFATRSDAVVNAFLTMLHLPTQDWLGQMDTAFMATAFVQIWKGVGYYFVIFYAGIMDIPRSLYEAATVDGATGIQKFFHITIPNLKSVTATVISLCTISVFKIFDIIYVMTKGGPAYATTTLVHRVRAEAFEQWDFGYASAIAVTLLAIILVVTLIENKFLKRED